MLSQRNILDGLFVTSALGTSAALVTSINATKMKGSTFAQHPIMAATGFSVVASAAYLMARTKQRSSTMVTVHQASMFAGTGAMYYALWVIYGVKESNKKKHVQTWHSYYGVGAAVALSLLTLGTTFATWTSNKDARRAIMKYHTVAGKVAGVTLAAAVVTGTLTTFKETGTRLAIAGSAVAATGIIIAAAALKRRPLKSAE
uniref:Cytochrome b561 domain-containing protein n=1 Tax=Neobodo designis TaxID=312471 RepID=A0A7S1MLD5_NEODS|mmetsp:Transcript_4231/g.13529  ORF Transcript_4231/g.13529 Transcript_4231/m.13529 type:complete len:202 (+) Transcript_4231:127-732(+)|eukprot:CAMPEP_0174849496 /NCGR_PEP_ID=MMETSP1114-20130205/16275_1 /TAXON_ID=312471 /ORGANISM="Neobodo designis, Strain CCAP 1951/1" /LENGTH=201 /DNA_ID=CAMNT_0016083847 /DNA_START=127 /DNA_END=732 /DNA_ORIENTATION=-